uniref:V-type proton ATPase subunit E-like n=1 Tax=Phallusia mammillata TaxID=59560 RepID=A0A6F9D7F0_9ASCI|nr:V-type proton ATPase subunit E-like [Phallusia mammillata]
MKMGLSDADVKKQIEHMIAFIDQEADEKVDEINAKAEEEFEIEKSRLVQQQRQKIMSFYERKEKQLEQQKKVQQSQLVNAARLKILKVREDHIEAILNEARSRLSEIQHDKARYTELMSGLIAQGLFQILEDVVVVQCVKEDVDIVKKAVTKAHAQYKKDTGSDVNIVINERDFLTPDTCGGVFMTSKTGAIKVKNTLDARLELMGRQMMPEIRETLFGKNQNRKFLS